MVFIAQTPATLGNTGILDKRQIISARRSKNQGPLRNGSHDGKQVSVAKAGMFTGRINVPVSALEAGIYLIKVTIYRKAEYLKFIKE